MKKHKTNILALIYISILAFITSSCTAPSIPENAEKVNAVPGIYPDYTDVTVPSNICPLNFCVKGSDEAVAKLTAGDKSYIYGEGCDIIINENEWEELRNLAKGKSINVEVYASKDGKWKAYKPFAINIAEEEIDPYISYRLIEPSYVSFEELAIAQRDLTTYDETDIYNNKAINTEKDAQCINCHSYQNYGTDRMLFHMRMAHAGTMIVDNGTLKKVDLKTDSTISAGVYPAWHPTLNLVAFSTNNTEQSFHTKSVNKVEVQDSASDLILYDVDGNAVTHISNDSNEFEVFPTWSPDGNTLYYCSAHFEFKDTVAHEVEVISRYKEIKYSLYSRKFDQKTHKFGEAELLYDAASDSMSVTLPRVSPDGKHIVFSRGEFGCFHVWHPEADIFIMDLATKEIKPLNGLNSNCSESYPSFSSNGRWIMADSRRDDNNYTRPYISYYDKNGKCHKAFELPQRDPHFYSLFIKSYNRPEFMKEAVKTTPQQLVSKARTEAVKATYKE